MAAPQPTQADTDKAVVDYLSALDPAELFALLGQVFNGPAEPPPAKPATPADKADQLLQMRR